MNKSLKTAVFLLRIALGAYFLYAGLSKVLDSSWSAAGYLNGTATLHGFYAWLASSANIGWVNFINKWGLTAIGISLLSGVAVRWASWAGIGMMGLYYFGALKFPYVGDHAYIIDEHIIYICAFLVLISSHAGSYWRLLKK